MAEAEAQAAASVSGLQLKNLTIDSLNDFYDKGNEVLNRLKHQILAASKQNDSQWEQRFSVALGRHVGPSTSIGVIGVTGSGKSSIINALLDQEVLVPTSCMQACTATVIEVAWNHSLEHEFIAEVEFLKTEDWRSDVSAALKDAVSNPAGLGDAKTEAGIAFKKITALYPSIDKRTIKQVTVDELMENKDIKLLLNTTIQINANSTQGMHDALQRYVEGKERLQSTYQDNNYAASSTLDLIGYWPLVRKVRIFARAFVLETGIVISDLPGIGDNNAARATVTQNHLGHCANIWVVTPISRAVDDSVARNLLGESFKRQLRRDGCMSKVAFICSKADELVVKELEDRLHLTPDFVSAIGAIHRRHNEREELHDSKIAEKERVQAHIKSMIRRLEDIGFQKSEYTRLKRLAKDGQAVYPLAQRRSKRMASSPRNSPHKQRKIQDYIFSRPSSAGPNQYSQSVITDTDDKAKFVEDSRDEVEQDLTQPTMDLAEITRKLDYLKEEERQLKFAKPESYAQLETIKDEISDCVMALEDLDNAEWDAYLRGRNTYVQQTLREDFANGIRELEEDEAQLDDETFDPDTIAEHTQEAKTQQDLPVFCVSSQGFQKLRDRLQKEKITGKFTSFDQTGVPNLARHCHKSGQDNLKLQHDTYVEVPNQLLTSVKFWLTGPTQVTTSKAPQTMQDLTEEMLVRLVNITEKMSSDANIIVIDRVVRVFQDGAQTAEGKSLTIVEEWTDKSAGVLRYMTYRAVVRRGGSFVRQQRSLNFAEDLLKPLLTHIDGVWNNVFNERIPELLNSLRKDYAETVSSYLASLNQDSEFLRAPAKIASEFQRQIARFRGRLLRLSDKLEELMKSLQQESNRLFARQVEKELQKICTVLDADSGPGVFARIKSGMHDGVASMKDRVFKESIELVEEKLKSGVVLLTDNFVDDINKLLEGVTNDCRQLFAKKMRGGKSVSPKHKGAIKEILEEAEGIFTPMDTESDAVAPSAIVEDDASWTNRVLDLPVRSSVPRTFSDKDTDTEKPTQPHSVDNVEHVHGEDYADDRSSLVLTDDEIVSDKDRAFLKEEVADWSP